MKILILDDMPERHDGFKAIFKNQGHVLVHAWTYFSCIEALEQAVLVGEPFQMACLDHDLGDNEKVEADFQVGAYRNHQFDGRDVCHFLVNNPRLCPDKILIHSWNPTCAVEMRDILNRGLPNKTVVVRAFGM